MPLMLSALLFLLQLCGFARIQKFCALDDWSAPQPCIDLAGKLAAAGAPVTITVYPGTYHGFDGPGGPARVRLEVPNGVNRGKGVTVAANPEARDDAYAKLKLFLRAQLGESQLVSAPR